MAEAPCPICGDDHKPLDPTVRYYYATAPDSPYHAGELAWFAAHGIDRVYGLTAVQAMGHVMVPEFAHDVLRVLKP